MKASYSASMHPDDWRVLESGNVHRRYKSLGQAFHRLKEAACLIVPTAEVYLRRLELKKFEPRESIALNWVHHLLTCPGGVPAGVE